MGLVGKQPGLVVAVLVPALLSSLVVVARSMRKVKRRPTYISRTGALTAEILLILSVISGWISGIFVFISIHYGFGRHQDEILAEHNGMHNLIRAAFWQTTGYSFNVGCYTLSVVGQVIHYRTWLFHNVEGHSSLSMAMNASGLLQGLFGILCVICVFAKCTPVTGSWDPTVSAKCWDDKIFLGINYTSSAITFVSYMIQGFIPIHMALSLGQRNITKSQWTTLAIIAFWNVIAGVLALVKLSFLGLYVETVDATWRRVILVEIGLAENGASGIVPSAAEMWAIAQQLVNRSAEDSRTGISKSSRNSVPVEKRMPSSGSDVELTGINAGIMKTTAWEMSTDVHHNVEDWDKRSEEDCPNNVDFQPAGVGARAQVGSRS